MLRRRHLNLAFNSRRPSSSCGRNCGVNRRNTTEIERDGGNQANALGKSRKIRSLSNGGPLGVGFQPERICKPRVDRRVERRDRFFHKTEAKLSRRDRVVQLIQERVPYPRSPFDGWNLRYRFGEMPLRTIPLAKSCISGSHSRLRANRQAEVANDAL